MACRSQATKSEGSMRCSGIVVTAQTARSRLVISGVRRVQRSGVWQQRLLPPAKIQLRIGIKSRAASVLPQLSQ